MSRIDPKDVERFAATLQLRSAHSFFEQRWDEKSFLGWRTDGAEGSLLEAGFTLTQIRAARGNLSDGKPLPGSGSFQNNNAYTNYVDFLDRIRTSKRELASALPVRIRVTRANDAYRAAVVGAPSGCVRTIACIAERKTDARAALLGYLASEFADDLAMVLGDTAAVRIFAHRVLHAARRFQSDKAPKAPTPSEISSELKEIASLATKLATLMEISSDARLLIEHRQAALCNENPKKTVEHVIPGVLTRTESDDSFEARRSVIPWRRVQFQLKFMARAASACVASLPKKRGRVGNRENNYTPLVLIADAWQDSFGEAPSAAPRSRFLLVVGYCLLLFTHHTIDVRAGLKYREQTTQARQLLGRAWKGKNLSLFEPTSGQRKK